VRTLDDLRKLRVGQGKDWIDVPIFSKGGFNVIEGTSYRGLFAMLDAGRFDFFSRGIDEAGREFKRAHRQLSAGMAIEPTLLLQYTLPLYFFLRRDAEGALLAQAYRGWHGNDDQGRIDEQSCSRSTRAKASGPED
jgi:hypothetical protein